MVELLNDYLRIYFEMAYLVTALVPSDTACLVNSPGSRSQALVWTSREKMVDLPLWFDNFEDSLAILSKMTLTKEFIILMRYQCLGGPA